jgi:hypothetical protein
MSFFEPPPRTTASVFRAEAVSLPAWLGPPHNVLPGIAPVELVIARANETVVAIAGIRAFPEGFAFTLSLRLRPHLAQEARQFPYLLDCAAVEGDALPNEFLRFGVQFSDGRKATNLDRPPYNLEGQGPERPVLNQLGGAGGGSAWDMEQWVWPLPSAGPLAFVCEWPSRGIAESRADIDAGLILEAAGRAVTLWSV